MQPYKSGTQVLLASVDCVKLLTLFTDLYLITTLIGRCYYSHCVGNKIKVTKTVFAQIIEFFGPFCPICLQSKENNTGSTELMQGTGNKLSLVTQTFRNSLGCIVLRRDDTRKCHHLFHKMAKTTCEIKET
jgi:hypothetical protein